MLSKAQNESTIVRYRDLAVDDEAFRARLISVFERLLAHGQLIMGPEVAAFERTVAAFCGTKHCVGVASGTSALYLALKSFGIGPGDEVITTPMSWIATLNAIHATGATPVFADVRGDLNIDPDAVVAAFTARTGAIVPVHYTGRICAIDAIIASARNRDILVIEDAAQAMGATLPDGRRAGGFGHAGAFSLNPMKVLYGFGEAGAVTTNDADAVKRLEALRYLGTENKEVCIEPELNHKIDALQAALLCESFSELDRVLEARKRIAQRYSDALGDMVHCPDVPREGDYSAIFFEYTILAERRDALQEHLAGLGIETKVRHPILMPDQPAYSHLDRPDIPQARRLVERILSLPCQEKLSEGDIERVIDGVRAFYKRNPS